MEKWEIWMKKMQKKTMMKIKSNSFSNKLMRWSKNVNHKLNQMKRLLIQKEIREETMKKVFFSLECSQYKKIFSLKFWKKVFMKKLEIEWDKAKRMLMMKLKKKRKKIIYYLFSKSWAWKIKEILMKKQLFMWRMRLSKI